MKGTRVLFGTLALVSAILICVPGLAGCGNRLASADPFVGTWRQPGNAQASTTPIAIAKVPGGYRAVMMFVQGSGPGTPVQIPLTRHGNQLVGAFVMGTYRMKVEIDYLPQSAHLTWSNASGPGGQMTKPTELVKVSDSTAVPTSSAP